jgi:hypothetical protein
MLWYEQSLTPSELKRPDFKVSTKYFFCEQDSKWVFGDSDDYFYEEVERKDSSIVSPTFAANMQGTKEEDIKASYDISDPVSRVEQMSKLEYDPTCD